RLYTYGSLAALAAEGFGADAYPYQDAQALAQALEKAMQPDVCLLVKGSRVNRLERIVEALAPEAASAVAATSGGAAPAGTASGGAGPTGTTVRGTARPGVH